MIYVSIDDHGNMRLESQFDNYALATWAKDFSDGRVNLQVGGLTFQQGTLQQPKTTPAGKSEQ